MTRRQKRIYERAADAEAGDRTDRGKCLTRKAHDGRRITAQADRLPVMDGRRSGSWRRFRFLPGIRPRCGILRQADDRLASFSPFSSRPAHDRPLRRGLSRSMLTFASRLPEASRSSAREKSRSTII